VPRISKRQFILFASTALIIVFLCWLIGYLFFFPAWNYELSDIIVPDTAIRLKPPPGEEVQMWSASDRLWYEHVYNVPDMNPEEVVNFYQGKRFRCEFLEDSRPLGVTSIESSFWRCVRPVSGPRSDGIHISADPNNISDGSIIYIVTDFRTW
jgi:hypothetical protein